MLQRKLAILTSEQASGRNLAARRAFNRDLGAALQAGEKRKRGGDDEAGDGGVASSWKCVNPYPQGTDNMRKRMNSCERGGGGGGDGFPNRQECVNSCYDKGDEEERATAAPEKKETVVNLLLEGRVYDAFLRARKSDADRMDNTPEGALLRRDLRGALQMALKEAGLERVPYDPVGLVQLVEMGLYDEAHESASGASARRREVGLEAAVLEAHVTGDWEEAHSQARYRVLELEIHSGKPLGGPAVDAKRAQDAKFKACLVDGGFDKMLQELVGRGFMLDARDLARECGSESGRSAALEDLLIRGEFRAVVEKFEKDGAAAGQPQWQYEIMGHGTNKQGLAQLVVAGVPDVAKMLLKRSDSDYTNATMRTLLDKHFEHALLSDNMDDARRMARELYNAHKKPKNEGCTIA